MKKRFFAMILAVILVLAQGMTVFASGPSNRATSPTNDPNTQEPDIDDLRVYDTVMQTAHCEHSNRGVCVSCRKIVKKVEAYEASKDPLLPNPNPDPNIVKDAPEPKPEPSPAPKVEDGIDEAEREARLQLYLESFDKMKAGRLNFVNTDDDWKIAPVKKSVASLELEQAYDVRLAMPDLGVDDDDQHDIAIQVLAPTTPLKADLAYGIAVNIIDFNTNKFYGYTAKFQVSEKAQFELCPKQGLQYEVSETNGDYYLHVYFTVHAADAECESLKETTTRNGLYGSIQWFINTRDWMFIDAYLASKEAI